MERALIFIAGGLAVIAILLFTRGHYDSAFVTAALGLVAWFFKIRTQLRSVMAPNEEIDDNEKEDGDDEVEV